MAPSEMSTMNSFSNFEEIEMGAEDIKYDFQNIINELLTSIDEMETLGFLERIYTIVTDHWEPEFSNFIFTKPFIYRLSAILIIDNKLIKNLTIKILANIFYEIDFIKPIMMT